MGDPFAQYLCVDFGLLKTEPKEQVSGPDIPQTCRWAFGQPSGVKHLSEALEILEKNRHVRAGGPRPEGADVHSPRGRQKNTSVIGEQPGSSK